MKGIMNQRFLPKITKFVGKVEENRKLSESVNHITINCDVDFLPGQYVSVMTPSKVRKPYSLASVPGKGMIEFCVKNVGDGSEYVCNLRKGDEVDLFGPAGKFVVNDEEKNLVFVCTGTGISTFVSMIPSLLENGFKKNIVLIKGFRNDEDVLYDDLFGGLVEKYSNFKFVNVLSSDGKYVQDVVDEYVAEDTDYYICGLKDMITSVKEKLIKLGVDGDDIFKEKYD